ncbi:MAG: hypothetical protein Aurels2KO_32070 [Aureliella sp.]
MIDATALESRILYSAVPLVDVASGVDAPDVAMSESAETSFAASFADEQVPAATQEEESEAADALPLQQSAEGQTLTVVVIDESVPDYDALVTDIMASADPGESIQIVTLAQDADGIDQLSELLAGMSGVDSVHIFSHGSTGEVQLGSTTLSSQSIGGYTGQLSQWASAFSADADILFYGCELGSGEGELLVEAIAELTGADVAASADLTGHAELGGNWVLEVSAGSIETDVAVSLEVQSQWHNVLATYTVTTTSRNVAGSLGWAIADANANPGLDTIVFDLAGTGVHTFYTGSIGLPSITDPVIIDGTTDDSFAANGNSPAILVNGGAFANTGIELTPGASGSTIRGLAIGNYYQLPAIHIHAGSNNNTIVGNYIGELDANGEASVGTIYTSAGVLIEGANNTIGGTTAADRNVISSNHVGVEVHGSAATGNQIIGNFVGTNALGNAAAENETYGVYLRGGAQNNMIGGSGVGEGNVISGNAQMGVYISGEDTDNNTIQGNKIGVNAAGTDVLANALRGISIGYGSDGILIGGPTTDAGNWIAGSELQIFVFGESTDTVIQNNTLGTDLTGTANWGAAESGIYIVDANGRSPQIQILQNTIAFSGQVGGPGGDSGIAFFQTVGNEHTILQNLIYGSTGLGIDLCDDGVTANDEGDGDSGPNNRQNFPVLSSATTIGSDTVVVGSLNSNASTSYRIEFFSSPSGHSTGYGGATTYLGFINVTTDASGDANFSTTLAGVAVSAGHAVTATATVDHGNGNYGGTSEFAANTLVIAGNAAPSGTPAIAGTATENQTLTVDTSAINDGDGLGTFSYQWLRDGVAITGATNSTYTLGDADVGSQTSVQVSYTDGNGNSEGPLTSDPTAAVSNVNDTPTGTPTITGTVAENQTLTADTSGISDGDGLGTFGYQWLRDGSAITGATGSTYTLGDADVGSQISVQVSYTDGNGSSESVTSSQTATVTNVNDSPTGTPTITGTVAENQTLTAGTSAISDGDGLGTLSYQWLRDGSAITGATGSTYTLGDADVGSQISVQVSYTDGNGSSESVTSTATAAVSNVNDTPSGTPTITGTVAENQTLTADTSAISDGDGLGTLSYQWLRDGSAITGATGSTYTLGDADVGSQISVRVSYTDGNGSSESVTSAATAAVTNVNDSPTGTPTITGTIAENETLTADTSGISDGDGLGTLSYQWLRDGSAITGATGSTYTLGDADVGSQISVQVSYTDGNGSSESVTSTATAAVSNVNDTPSGTPTITGTVAENETLTADTSAISDGDGLGTLSYQWLRDGSAITGATGSTYTLGDADVGSQISVQVSYTDGNGSSESVTSAATASVTNVNDSPTGTPAITGTVAENETLTADTSAISDGDGLGTLSYQWLRDGSAITGATGSTYTLGDADVGSQISVEVSYTDGNGSSESVKSMATAAVSNVNDMPTGAPTITGTAAEDQTLTADTSAISDGDGLGTLS